MDLIENVNLLEPNLAEFIGIARKNAEDVDVCPITLPSGGWVIIREQNGDDDGIVSNASLQKDASSINLFVAAIVAYSPLAKNKDNMLTLDEVLSMPVRDKYAIIIKSRIFSMGNLLEFTYIWDDSEGIPDNYEEDLMRFIWDYSSDFPHEPKDKDYDAERVATYKVKPDVEGWIYMDTQGKVGLNVNALSPDPNYKRLKFKLLDGFAERKLLVMGESGMSINTKFQMRELHTFIGGIWYKVESFKSFKPKEMATIRKVIADYDHEYEGNSIITNPRTDASVVIPLMSIPSFFFPQGI